MGSKVTLTYEDGKYTVEINGAVINVDKDLENSFVKFKSVIKNNVNAHEKSWSFIEDSIRAFDNKSVQINSEFKTVSIGDMKYFYTTGKVFYVGANNMVPLMGGYELVKFILKTPSLNYEENLKSFLELCKNVVECKANYRTGEENISVFSAALNYGSVDYNFNTKRINKGVVIESGTFDDFANYTLGIIKR